jgi:hypothetical protein
LNDVASLKPALFVAQLKSTIKRKMIFSPSWSLFLNHCFQPMIAEQFLSPLCALLPSMVTQKALGGQADGRSLQGAVFVLRSHPQDVLRRFQ